MSNTIIQSIFLGIVQGLGEFLPISSTAHLALLPYFWDFKDPGLAFDVALHLGTLIAVVGFFWKDWVGIISNSKFLISNQIPNPNAKNSNYSPRMIWFIVIATIPGVLAGLLFESKAEEAFRSPLLIAGALFIFGLILYLVDKCFSAKKDLTKINIWESIVIGVAQAIAIIPGVSRSGATMTAGRFFGLDRKSAARFSFLLSTPIIAGAAVLKIKYLLNNITDIHLILAIIFAAVSGWLAIKYILQFLEKYSYAVFFWYRTALAIIIVLFYFAK